MWTKDCHLLSGSVRIKSPASAVVDLQHPLKEVLGGGQEWDTLYSGENWQNRPSDT